MNEHGEMIVTELAEPVRLDWGVSPKGKLPPRAPRPLIGRGRAEGRGLGQWDRGWENAEMKAIFLR